MSRVIVDMRRSSTEEVKRWAAVVDDRAMGRDCRWGLDDGSERIRKVAANAMSEQRVGVTNFGIPKVKKFGDKDKAGVVEDDVGQREWRKHDDDRSDK